MVRMWTLLCPGVRLGAWALDEYKAYRQIPIDPEQRKFAVVAVANPLQRERRRRTP